MKAVLICLWKLVVVLSNCRCGTKVKGQTEKALRTSYTLATISFSNLELQFMSLRQARGVNRKETAQTIRGAAKFLSSRRHSFLKQRLYKIVGLEKMPVAAEMAARRTGNLCWRPSRSHRKGSGRQ